MSIRSVYRFSNEDENPARHLSLDVSMYAENVYVSLDAAKDAISMEIDRKDLYNLCEFFTYIQNCLLNETSYYKETGRLK